jgi:hypothetical protein
MDTTLNGSNSDRDENFTKRVKRVKIAVEESSRKTEIAGVLKLMLKGTSPNNLSALVPSPKQISRNRYMTQRLVTEPAPVVIQNSYRAEDSFLNENRVNVRLSQE